jgi:glycosyltransferase involved in cell wall biosynthesis
MKLAIVVPGGVDRSGEYRVIPALLSLLKRLARDNEVHVFALRQEKKPGSWNLFGAQVHNVGHGHVMRAVAAIAREHRAAPFEVVQSFWSGLSGFVAVTAARALRVPSIVHVAGGELAAIPAIRYGGRLHWRGRLREAFVLRGATVVTAASAPMLDAIAALGIEARRVPLGVDLQCWPLRPPIRRAGDSAIARLIHVASLNRVKDQPTLLRALAHLADKGCDFHLDVAGEDTLDAAIQREAASLGLTNRIAFHGFLPQRALRPLVEAAHVNIVSSRHEAGPLVVLEAAAAGVPTVGTYVGHIAEWAPAAAVAVPVGDSARLADGLLRLLGDEELRMRMAHEAQRRAASEDADHTARSFVNLCREIIKR